MTVTLAPNSVSTVIVVALKPVIVPPRPKAAAPPLPAPKYPKPLGPPRRGRRPAGRVVEGVDELDETGLGGGGGGAGPAP
ncbi:MAG: hypothetical protein ACLP36_05995, partial [Acidimicrobiales bacterium]